MSKVGAVCVQVLGLMHGKQIESGLCMLVRQSRVKLLAGRAIAQSLA